MKPWVIFMGLVVAACSGSRTPAAGVAGASGSGSGSGSGSDSGSGSGATALPSPPAGFVEADLITIDGGEITTWSLAGGKVAKLGSVKLAEVDPEDYTAQLDGDWGDREHFFVHVPPRTVLKVTASAITQVTVPPEATFKTPRPKVEDDDGLEAGGVMESRDNGLVITAGEAWWSECPWGFPYDGWQCETYVSAQLWPAAKVVNEQVTPHGWSWAGTKAPGFKTKLVDDDHALSCTPPPGIKQRKNEFRGDSSDGEAIYGHEWVSVTPPRLLVVLGSPGLADLVQTRWSLHDGCMEKPLAKGSDVQPGPGDLWLAQETDDPTDSDAPSRQVIWRGAASLGEVPGDVRFRPLK